MSHILLLLFLLNSDALLATSDALEYSQLEVDEGVKYLAYTRNDKKNSVDMRQVDFTDDYGTVFIVHGFETKTLDKSSQVKNDIFQFNLDVERVIIVSWLEYSHASAGIALSNYEQVAQYHVPLLAQDIFEKIVHIRDSGAKGNIEIIGHSIGAHVGGQTGKLLKNQTNYTLDQIFGLDPAGEFFEQNRASALSNEDAKNVVVIHTNMNAYGFGSLIGPNDRKVNGGEKQSNCIINIDFCSHNEAWNSFSLFLRKKLIEEVKQRVHPYVICMDVSGSMNSNKRLERAIYSAQKVISNVKPGSYLGFVKFNDAASKVHDIVQLYSLDDKKSLVDSMPSTAGSTTSIGGGLRFSMDMLRAMPNSTSLCSTIVLISDGEHNTGESAQNVLPELQDNCIAVSTMGMGKDASGDLEAISSVTGGVVTYAMEDGTSNDVIGTIRALSYLFETETDKPIHLQSKEVVLGSGAEDNVHFMIDDTVGTDTEFNIISYDAGKIDLKLTSPDGDVFTSASPEYFYDNFSEKGFRIAFAEEGQWTLTITVRVSKRRRSIRPPFQTIAVAVATTHQKNDAQPAIRLTVVVSDRVLEYPKPITVTAELHSGEFPIIHADVFANIRAPYQPLIRLPLHDNGVYPDELANDGIYTNDVVKLPNPERYSVVVTAKSNSTTMMVPRKVNYFTKMAIDCEKVSCIKVNEFQRESDVGSIKLLSNANQNEIPPNSVSDLRAVIENIDERIFTLEWSSPANELFDISVKHYDIRALINGPDFDNGVKFDKVDIVDGSFDVVNSSSKNEKISIQMPIKMWDDFLHRNRFGRSVFKFALKSIGYDDNVSGVSNIASVSVKVTTEAPIVVKETTVSVTDRDVYHTTIVSDMGTTVLTEKVSDIYTTTSTDMDTTMQMTETTVGYTDRISDAYYTTPLMDKNTTLTTIAPVFVKKKTAPVIIAEHDAVRRVCRTVLRPHRFFGTIRINLCSNIKTI